MASYIELYAASGGGQMVTLRQQICVAISIKALAVSQNGTATAAQKAWAINALDDPVKYQDSILRFILAQFSAQSIATISSATDTQVQTAVNSAVETLLGA